MRNLYKDNDNSYFTKIAVKKLIIAYSVSSTLIYLIIGYGVLMITLSKFSSKVEKNCKMIERMLSKFVKKYDNNDQCKLYRAS
jgi:amino acid permease